MIRCHRSDLAARCRERGYTLAEVMPCVVEQDGDSWLVDPSHEAYPRPRGVGFGDWVARGLSAVGITKERVSAAMGGDCGCDKRQEAMNRWGREHLGIGLDAAATVDGERDADAAAGRPPHHD